MAPVYLQADRPMRIATPLGPDLLLLAGLSGSEGISQLYQFQLDCLAPLGVTVPYGDLLGKPITVTLLLSDGAARPISGICSRISQGERDDKFTMYRIEMVPELWLLTRKSNSRIFQQKTVPDILKTVLDGLQVDYKLTYDYQPRNYCVQYRETDFNFISRLMEEEGIFYYFKHQDGGHQLVLTDTPTTHPRLPWEATLKYQPATHDSLQEEWISQWEKTQELRPGKFTTWDQTFELPGQNLEQSAPIVENVSVGAEVHPLRSPSFAKLEMYDFPGEVAQRFDGIGPSGSERPTDIEAIRPDAARTLKIRMEQGATPALTIRSASRFKHLAAGYRFNLVGHFSGNGPYLITGVRHDARIQSNYESGETTGQYYQNSFTCIPANLPFRPQRTTPKPVIQGTQTAVVVGPAGEEIFPDKFGRVKVQFAWDREGQKDLKSSCWVRVGQVWAGKNWGAIQIPRIGHEVIVAFEEGDPDCPIIIGSVYNADNMPPFPLPDSKTISGMKSNTHKGQGYNEMVMDDTAGKELIRVHAQYDMDATVLHDDRQLIENNRTIVVNGKHTETIKKDTSITVTEGNFSHDVQTGSATIHVKKDVNETFDANQTTNVAQAIVTTSQGSHIHLTAATDITLICGASSLTMKADGTIILAGAKISLTGTASLDVSAPKVAISGDAEASMGVGSQSMKCDLAKLETMGAMITSAAQGVNEIRGLTVKLN